MNTRHTPPCPCGSDTDYTGCCRPLHLRHILPATAEMLMRARYSAYVLHLIDYIVATTVPAQQAFLNAAELMQWSIETEWLGLNVLSHKILGKDHAQVGFEAYFRDRGNRAVHHELSAFVKIAEQWYFIDPTVPLPAMKQPCICGSGKKFKACCGKYLQPAG
ncbi:YchJ family protein [Neisseria lactamica]|uniref:YchJ family protein n=1 Tax=Neisseria lactamica TaxID=486 RepID=UPI0002E6A623|nr:YchJ family protein [Neisseria lactamica]